MLFLSSFFFCSSFVLIFELNMNTIVNPVINIVLSPVRQEWEKKTIIYLIVQSLIRLDICINILSWLTHTIMRGRLSSIYLYIYIIRRWNYWFQIEMFICWDNLILFIWYIKQCAGLEYLFKCVEKTKHKTWKKSFMQNKNKNTNR